METPSDSSLKIAGVDADNVQDNASAVKTLPLEALAELLAKLSSEELQALFSHAERMANLRDSETPR